MEAIHQATACPDGPVRPRDRAEVAAEAVRALNHATFGRGDPAGYVWPSDVDAVIGQLQVLVERLPQVLEQAQDWLLAEQAAGRVGHDTAGRRPGFAVGVVVGCLNEAALRLRPVTDALAGARRESSHLTGVVADQVADKGADQRDGQGDHLADGQGAGRGGEG